MRARNCAKRCADEWAALLKADGAAMGWRTLADMSRADLERCLTKRATTAKDPEKPESVMGARMHNVHVTAFSSFGNWCFRQGYAKANPFTGTARRDEQGDRRRTRRAMSAAEIGRLIEAARTRPEREARLVTRGPRKGEYTADLSDKTLDSLRWLGETRAMFWKTLALTGLRVNEARSITLGNVMLDADPPHLLLAGRDAKNRKAATVPLQRDFAQELAGYVAERKARLLGQRGVSAAAFPGAFDAVPVFDVPMNMSKVFDADRKAADIPKHDGAGRVVDCHCLRHSFATALVAAKVPVHVAQKLLRHATPQMTLGVYSHANVGDMADAVNALPLIGWGAGGEQKKAASALAPTLAHNSGFSRASEAVGGRFRDSGTVKHGTDTKCVSPNNDRGILRVAVGGSDKEMARPAGLEPAALSLEG
ncbi:MAG: site-specific integrase [Candidatus Hydrogenedens sp.]|nr:site-specific integrase [Candidatus Hydrogenedens sp.]